MLLRVYVQSREEFNRWIEEQSQVAHANPAVSEGQRIFKATACINCHGVTARSQTGASART